MGIAEVSGPVDAGPALDIVREMSPLSSSDIIPLLQRLQDAYGYLPREVVLDVCERTGLPASRVFGVATFYSQFHLEPRGRHVGPLLPRHGVPRPRRAQESSTRWSRRSAIRDGETTPDMQFSLETDRLPGNVLSGAGHHGGPRLLRQRDRRARSTRS